MVVVGIYTILGGLAAVVVTVPAGHQGLEPVLAAAVVGGADFTLQRDGSIATSRGSLEAELEHAAEVRDLESRLQQREAEIAQLRGQQPPTAAFAKELGTRQVGASGCAVP